MEIQNNRKKDPYAENPGTLNIGIPSSISPRNQKEERSFRTESDGEDMNSNGAVIIDD